MPTIDFTDLWDQRSRVLYSNIPVIGWRLPPICQKLDIEEFDKFKKTGQSRGNFWKEDNGTVNFTTSDRYGRRSVCNICGGLEEENYYATFTSNYRMIPRDPFIHPGKMVFYYYLYEEPGRLELESRRLLDEQMLAVIGKHRLLELLFDKLLSVLPFEIVYMIMYSY